MSRKISVIVVDDHELVRSGISSLLGHADDIVIINEAKSGEDAIQLCRHSMPDVVIMDINMPGIGGLEATHKLLRINPNIRILILSVYSDNLFPNKLMKAGAYGYITKGSTTAEMVKAIRAIHSGQRYISPEIASQLALQRLDGDNESPFSQLSDRELQVTIMICSGDKVQAIADNLCLSPKTINSYRYRIFEKLNIHNDVELTHLALKHNILTQTSHENS
ncbi:MAG: two-component system response regulator UvrY [Legionellales bacterium]|nr:two-component system response regulator UvrY [Legionellales bacterium]|tara:strand:- start:2022 stop:2684 length:663 start_codon:yes stop_codon:yes gene_type:complete